MLVLGLGIYILATTSVQTVHVVGASMYPSLHDGDLLVSSKVDYRLHGVERGDIIILRDPLDPRRDFIKRVIGLPGDHLLIHDHQVLVNGVPLAEPYLGTGWTHGRDWPAPPANPTGDTVPADSYFVLGDNRDHSSDSRLFGYIRKGEIDGKAVLRIWPLERFQPLDGRPTLNRSPLIGG